MAKTTKQLVIAIDGPAGTGKSTVSKIIAKKLGLLYIDTGAMYRALTLKAMQRGVSLEDEKALVELAKSTKIGLKEDKSLRVLLDGVDVSRDIRTPEVTANVKYIARVPDVRHEMVVLQRSIGSEQGAVLEGRDIGTVVFPNADYKFYLDASPEERAKRRLKDMIELGQKTSLEDVKKNIIARDESDMKRAVGALKVAEGAIVIDTTELSINEVVKTLIDHIA